MWPTSQRFLDSLWRGGTPVIRAEVFEKDINVGADPLPLSDGSLNLDSLAAVRRRAQLVFGSTEETIISGGDDLLFPKGREIFLQAGFVYEDGTDEFVPIGMLRITKPRNTNSRGILGSTLEALDRGRTVSRAKFTRTHGIDDGTPVDVAIRSLVERGFPWFTDGNFDFSNPDDETTPKLTLEMESDPWQVALNLADSAGLDLLFDPNGKCILAPFADLSSAEEAFAFETGPLNTAEELNNEFDDENSYNGVIVVGQTTSGNTAPVKASAWDRNPESPTYYDPDYPELSVYGPVPLVLRLNNVRNLSTAQKAAKKNLAKVLGIQQSLSFGCVPNYAFEGNDLVRIIDAGLKTDRVCSVESFQFGFGLGARMSGVMKSQPVIT